jgi:iron complex transport system ATP-binding protein
LQFSAVRKQPKPVLDVSNLRIERDQTVILDDISWQIQPGQHWVVLGANGCGKTSLLSALTGYFMPSSGEIELLGERYGESDWRELRKKIGLVSSSIRQMMAETETALETVASGKYAMIDFWGTPSKADQQKASRILKQIECVHLAERPWSFLSQGERQRVLIGRALMAQPSLLILDEPCAGLDPVAREHFLQFVNRLGKNQNSPTLVLITHHVEEVMPIFSHALFLKKGRVLVSGEKSKVLTAKNFSEAFGAPVRLKRSGAKYQLSITATKNVII